MKKSIGLVLATLMICTMLVSCGNRQTLDLTYTFDRAIIRLPDDTIVDGKVQSWRDYEDGDQIQIKIDGITYLVHMTNVVLIKE